MRIESLVQFLVPMIFVSIWALTSLFNREVQSLPPRAARPPRPNEPKPSGFDLQDDAFRGDAPGRPVPPPGRSANDGIVILSQDARRPPGLTPGARPGSQNARRSAKGRPGARLPNRSPEPATPRALSASMTPGMASQATAGHALKPLTLSHDPHLSPASTEAAATFLAKADAIVGVRPEEIGRLAADPALLRDSFILGGVVFGPPASVRNGTFRRTGRGA